MLQHKIHDILLLNVSTEMDPNFYLPLPWPLSAMKSKDDIGMTMMPTMRSAMAKLMMNMLDTVCSLFSVLMANIIDHILQNSSIGSIFLDLGVWKIGFQVMKWSIFLIACSTIPLPTAVIVLRRTNARPSNRRYG